jgi:hypothetical protein
VERQEKQGHDAHLYEARKRLRKANTRLKEERDILNNPFRRAVASLVAGETLRSRGPCFGGRRDRSLIGGGYHPGKKRGPGNLADWRVVTP